MWQDQHRFPNVANERTLAARLWHSNNLSCMLQTSSVSLKIRPSKIIFILTIATAIFWIISKSFNVYRWSVIGAIFEILWFPGLIILFILPIVSLVFWAKEKFRLKSLNPYSILIALAVLLSTIFFK